MEVLRAVQGFKLNKGTLAASGLYNITSENAELVSPWFGEDTKDELLNMSDGDFLTYAHEHATK